MFLLWSFYSVVLCCATLCSVVTACFEDMTPVTHLHPERVTDCVPVSRLFAPSLSPCLDCSRLEITLSLPHSAITSHSPLFPVGASRSYPSSPWYQLPTTNRPTPCLSPTFQNDYSICSGSNFCLLWCWLFTVCFETLFVICIYWSKAIISF